MAGSKLTSYVTVNAQKISTTSTASVLSADVGTQTTTFRFAPQVSVWMASGSSTVTASSTGASNSIYIPGESVEYINIGARDQFIAVIADGSSGFINIAEAT